MSDKEKQLLVSEVNIMRKLKHPHVVRYYDHIVDYASADLYVITEYCPNGDLGALVQLHALEEYVEQHPST
jgi:serine/threonine protein kinase